jgi:hypothetical protein
MLENQVDDKSAYLWLPKCGEKPLDSSMGMKAVKVLII